MYPGSPKDVPDDLLPIVVASMCRFKVIRQEDVRTVVLLTEDPWHFRPVPLSEIAIVLVLHCFKTVRGCLVRCRQKEVFHLNKLARVNKFE